MRIEPSSMWAYAFHPATFPEWSGAAFLRKADPGG